MVFTPDAPFPKTKGHVIKSKDWNDAITEVQRLDTAKVNKSGDSVTGSLTIAGNAGVGTTSPQAKLHVAGGGVRWGNNSELVTDQGGSLELGGNNSTAGAGTPYVDFHFSGLTQDFNARIVNDANGRLSVLAPTLQASGNVGIGTPTPADRLDVAGNLRILTGSNPIRFTSAWSGFPDPVNNQAEISNDTGTYKTLMIIGNKSAGMGRRVSVWDRLEVNGTLQITASLGIGTQSPTHMFHVVAPDAVGLFESSGGAAYLRLSNNEGLNNRVEITNRGGGRLSLWTAGFGDAFNILRDGRVGVRTASPQVALHTVGNRIRVDSGNGRTLDMRADGGALDLESNGADLYINNNNVPVRIRNQQSVSSRELKENITDLSIREAKEALEDLVPVSFTWKDDEEKTRHVGFIAEDAPEIARSTDAKGIIPMHILAILSKVVRDQQRVISSMRERLLELGDA